MLRFKPLAISSILALLTTISASAQLPHQDATFLWAADGMAGHAVAWGDFNADGHMDLAVGAPFATADSEIEAGTVTLYYGLGGGKFGPAQALNQISVSSPEEGDHFGYALAAGDFDCDGADDLAVGAPDENWNGSPEAGVVSVYSGSFSTPAQASIRSVYHNVLPVGTTDTGDRFGAALTTGNFRGGSCADLAIGAPGDAAGAVPGAGTVTVIRSDGDGLDFTTAELLHQDTPNVPGGAETGDLFGASLASGDTLSGSSTGWDLAVGVPGEAIGAVTNAGAANLFVGDFGGFVEFRIFALDVANVDGSPQAGEQFGFEVAFGNLNCNEGDELLVSSPFHDSFNPDEGRIHLFPEGQTTESYAFSSISVFINGLASASLGDLFGYAMDLHDLDKDGCDDLLVGSPHGAQPDPANNNGGAFRLYYGQTTDLTEDSRVDGRRLRQSDHGNLNDGAFDLFGASIGVAPAADAFVLAVGVPGEFVDSGAVTAVLGSFFGSRFESADLSHWNP